MFGLSFKARGASVDFLLCDEALNACSECTYLNFSKKKILSNMDLYQIVHLVGTLENILLLNAGIKTLKYSEFLILVI